jgi:hypothetical protein
MEALQNLIRDHLGIPYDSGSVENALNHESSRAMGSTTPLPPVVGEDQVMMQMTLIRGKGWSNQTIPQKFYGLAEGEPSVPFLLTLDPSDLAYWIICLSTHQTQTSQTPRGR